MKLAIKGLIALIITSCTLLSTHTRSNAQVNMNMLTEVAKSCQEDMFSSNYYKKMLLKFDFSILARSNEEHWKNIGNGVLSECLYSRYHYLLVVSKFPWLDSTGEIISGYPSSVLIAYLADSLSYIETDILDCIVSENTSSRECNSTKTQIARGLGYKFRNISFNDYISYSNFYKYDLYLVYVCPSCVIAHDELSNSQQEMLTAFINWFLKLDQPKRRELMTIVGDGENAYKLREILRSESEKAKNKYWEVRQRIETQERERRRRELLGE